MAKKRNRAPSEADTAEEAASSAVQPACFAPDALLRATEQAASFATATPYPHSHLSSVFLPPALLAVRQELGLLSSTFKETDLFKVYQTGDLANLDEANPEHAAALPSTIALRAALYSPAFRSFVRTVTGCPPLTAQQDCSCNAYRRGGHLLCHDDVIGTRCVSYVIYLSRPGKQWSPRLGGALELYAVSSSSGSVLPSPVAGLPPEFGTLVLFRVQPGVSYHAVQEVASKEARLSISGWFHAATPPEGADSIATLAQLERGGGGGGGPKARVLRRPPRPRKPLTTAQEARLAAVVHPAYLIASTIDAVRAQLDANGAALLSSFLRPEIAAALVRATSAADRRDGLDGGAMPSAGPPFTAGTRRKGWRLLGPPQLRRMLRYRPKPAAGGTGGTGEGGEGADEGAEEAAEEPGQLRGAGAQLDAVRQVMQSAAFVQLLARLSGLAPVSCAAEVRRFRPGLDYTLAHIGTQAASETLDATLTFVASRAKQRASWESGDVGGFECHVQAAGGHGAAEVYRADEGSEGVTSIHAQANALSLVRRGTDTMKFIKYVSAMAPGSRWDIAAEYACSSAEGSAP